MTDVFISYKKEERERVLPMAEALAGLAVSVWFDAQLSAGKSFTEEIREELNGCRAQLVLWSPASVLSEWVRGEAEFGRQRSILVAVKIEPCDLLPPFNMLHAEELAQWRGDVTNAGWLAVVRRIGSLLNRPGLESLQRLIGTDDVVGWKAWCLQYPDDPFYPEAARRAGISDAQPSTEASPVAKGHPAPPLRAMSLQELRSALEAAEFRLRVYRGAAVRYGWRDSEEEVRLTVEAAALRRALESQAGKGRTEGTQQPWPIGRIAWVQDFVNWTKWASPIMLGAMLALAMAVVLVVLAANSPQMYVPLWSTDAEEQVPIRSTDAEEQVLRSLGGEAPEPMVEQLYSGPFEAVGLDPRWAVQVSGADIRTQYAQDLTYSDSAIHRQVRSQGFFARYYHDGRPVILAVRQASCRLPNGVTTEYEAFLIVDAIVHDGCARTGRGGWPLRDEGATHWQLPLLAGVHEGY